MICVIATKEPLEIPDALLDDQISLVVPSSTLSKEELDLLFEAKTTKGVVTGKKRICLKEINSHNAKMKFSKGKYSALLPPVNVVDTNYIPNLTYFHFVTNKSVEVELEDRCDSISLKASFV